MASTGILLRSLTASSFLSRFFPLRWKYPHSAGACGWCLGERALAVGVLSAQRTQSRDSLECPRSPLPRISERTETAENSVFGCFLSFIDSATTAKGMRFKFPLNIQPNFLVYECKGVTDKMRAECVSLCVMSYWQLVFPTHIFTP